MELFQTVKFHYSPVYRFTERTHVLKEFNNCGATPSLSSVYVKILRKLG
jgi:hypothetical protein